MRASVYLKPQLARRLARGLTRRLQLKLKLGLTFCLGWPSLGLANDTPPAPAGILLGAPSVAGSRGILAAGEAPEEYVVAYGDTLFDLCEQLLGEGSYWPKLWSLNPYIKNPHFLWPGMRLRFYPGDDESPPSLAVVPEAEVVPLASNDPAGLDRAALVAELVKPTQSKTQLPEVTFAASEDLPLNLEGFELLGGAYESKQIAVTLPGFIFPEQLPASLCDFVGGNSGESMLGEQRSFLCQAQGPLEVGHTYTAVRFLQPVGSTEGGEARGWLYQFVAQVQLTHNLGKAGLVQGLVQKSRLGLEAGDLIIPYHATQRQVSLAPAATSKPSAEAQIIAFEHAGAQLGGRGSFVFLDQGLDAGLQPGQVFELSQSLTADYPQWDSSLGEAGFAVVGRVSIIESSARGSVGFILSNKREIGLGDKIRKF